MAVVNFWLTGDESSPERACLARKAQAHYGINLRPAQVTDAPVLERTALAFDAQRTLPEQFRQFIRALVRTTGLEQGNAYLSYAMFRQGVLDQEQRLQDILSNTVIETGPDFTARLKQVVEKADRGSLPKATVPVQKLAQDLLQQTRDGTLSSEQYLAFTRLGEDLMSAMKSYDPDIAHFSRALKDVLDDTLETTLLRKGQEEALASFRKVRQQEKNLLVLRELARLRNNYSMFAPYKLDEVLLDVYGDRIDQGSDDIKDLAEIGTTFLQGTPRSGESFFIPLFNSLAWMAVALGHRLVTYCWTALKPGSERKR
ncbi:hypothetical protein E3E11_06555 [Oecophyllibacter saccharovorans]|uniref:hypothetical protein n=1 Tax=Oecophyllibacter saccharovorans TaxID=2558360 RepID=UPI0011428D57|nr:hypothetical protein [Oecophyllibacter saccharovorans]QDH15565.1 hypothetical protein E3E11_06555 [Oecophyllibacter saccharovorans]